MWEYTHYDELYHYGVLGMKWGVRKGAKGYRSTSIKAARAKRANDKVDEGFKDWKKNTELRDNAISLGKKANAAKLAYENNKSDKKLKSDYEEANKQYKQALKKNTTYRKGVVRQEVGKDAARKYLSEAKKVKKLLSNDQSNRELQKKYNDLMSKHDVERAAARRAVEVSTKRSIKIANVKRGMTMAVKSAATTAAVAAGVHYVNRYLNSHDVTLNSKRVTLSEQKIFDVADKAKKVRDAFGYFY